MGMVGLLIALSEARRGMLEEDPGLLTDVIEHRHREPIPGLLDLDKAWNALDVLLGDEGEGVLGDAVLGRGGRPFGPELSYGRGRLLSPRRVAEVADALEGLPDDLVEEGYERLRGRPIHGGYGPKPPAEPPPELVGEAGDAGDDSDEDDSEERQEREELQTRLDALRAFYRTAAKRGQAVLIVVV